MSKSYRIRFVIEVEVPPTATVGDFSEAARRTLEHVEHPAVPRYPQSFEEYLTVLAFFAGEQCLDGPNTKLVAASGALVDPPSGECREHPAGGTPGCRRCYPLRSVA